jgi:hypothetical protein
MRRAGAHGVEEKTPGRQIAPSARTPCRLSGGHSTGKGESGGDCAEQAGSPGATWPQPKWGSGRFHSTEDGVVSLGIAIGIAIEFDPDSDSDTNSDRGKAASKVESRIVLGTPMGREIVAGSGDLYLRVSG